MVTENQLDIRVISRPRLAGHKGTIAGDNSIWIFNWLRPKRYSFSLGRFQRKLNCNMYKFQWQFECVGLSVFQLGKWVLCRCGNLRLESQLSHEAGHANTNCTGGGMICWPASLAESTDAIFSDRICLKKNKGNTHYWLLASRHMHTHASSWKHIQNKDT